MTAPGTMSFRGRLATVLVVAAVVRVLYLLQVASLPFFDHPVGDSAVYLTRAREIVAGQWLPERPFFYGSVYYPYLLAVFEAITRHGALVACAIQLLAGVALVGLLGLLARQWFGDRAALATAALAALYGPFAFLEADLLGVVWGLAALALALLGCERWQRAVSSRQTTRADGIVLAATGLVLGIAAAERPNLLVLIPVVAGWCAWVASGRPRAMATAAALVIVGAALPILGIGGLNLAGTGRWVPLTTSTGINLAIGYHPGATGTFEEPWAMGDQLTSRYTDLEEASVMVASRDLGRALTPEEASDYWRRRAADFVRARPVDAAAVTARRALLLLNGAEIPNHLNFAFMRRQASALWLMPVGFAAVLPLAAAGLAAALADERRRRAALLLLLVTAAAGASVLPFFVADRYRAPLVPALLVLAGLGAVTLGRLALRPEARREPQVAVSLVAALVALLVANLPLTRPLPARDQWLFAQAYEARGEHRAAARAYEAALSAEGDHGEILNNLGVTYRKLGAVAPAESAFRRAIVASPALAYPRKNLGMLLIAAHRWDEALSELEAAAELEPNDAETLGAIAALHAERGDHVRAAAAFRQAWRLAPGDRRLAGLAEYYPSLRLAAAEVSGAPPHRR